MADLDAARKILAAKFGFDDFLPGQGEAIGALLDGEDVFALWPTGGGKSLIYQFPAVARPGLTVVVSPLIALMRDQAQKMKKLGLSAAALHADQDAAAATKICDDVERGRLSLLYLSPERLANPDTLALLRSADVRLLAVDEAHCVSQWGHDFRPDYRRIAAASEALGFPQMVAATATAAPHTRADIVENLFARPPRVIAGSFRRKAIALSALPQSRDPNRQILELVEARRGQSGVIYCASRKNVDFLAQALSEAGHPAAAYHAGLAAEIREARQDEFLEGADRVMVATIAFGLGVDKPDVRYVIHRDAPDHLETLYQETGRAGRDGQPAEAIALFAPAAVAELRAARFEIARDRSGLGAPRKNAGELFLDDAMPRKKSARGAWRRMCALRPMRQLPARFQNFATHGPLGRGRAERSPRSGRTCSAQRRRLFFAGGRRRRLWRGGKHGGQNGGLLGFLRAKRTDARCRTGAALAAPARGAAPDRPKKRGRAGAPDRRRRAGAADRNAAGRYR